MKRLAAVAALGALTAFAIAAPASAGASASSNGRIRRERGRHPAGGDRVPD